MSEGRLISVEELGKHDSHDDAWVAINGVIWDVTEFAPTHPGGAEIVFQYMGQDASKAYNEVHNAAMVAKHLGNSNNKGRLDESTITEEWKAKQASNIESSKPTAAADEIPSLDMILNMFDFEAAAQKKASPKTWAFQSGAANDCLTNQANVDYYRKILFRPRVMVGVKDIDVSTTILGQKYSMPIFTAPAALAKLSHPDGELAMARGAVAQGTTICHCHSASYSLAEIREAMPENYPVFAQLYFNKDRAVTKRLLDDFNKYKPQAILVTVDLPVVGKREADERMKIDANQHVGRREGSVTKDKKGSGLARATGSSIDPDLKWADIKWIRSHTDIPLFLKGIQSAADARKALQCGCAGIYLSNHGGRAVDTAQPSILTLMEINANCPEVLEQMEVFIDGGIRRGTDILKAVCLGASAVCLGRPFLYSVGYGQDGVEHAFELLKDELETAMQMCGIKKLSEAHPGLLNTAELDRYVYRGDDHPWAKRIIRQARL